MSEIFTSYKLNTANAKQVGASAAIEEKGAYKGIFTRAELVQSKKGTQGIEFDFKADSGATAKYLSVWTVNGDGKELFGRKMIDAIMTCIGVKDMNATKAQITKWDSETRAEATVTATVFQQLMNRPIGIVLIREEYRATDGSTKTRNSLVCPFEAATNRIAIERLESHDATMLEKIVFSLKDKPLAKSGGYMPHAPSEASHFNQEAPSTFDSIDSDIPF